MVKFYIKSVVSTAVLTILLLLGFGLVKGIELSPGARKGLIVPIIVTTTFLVLNEKLSKSERWKWWMWGILVFVGFVASIAFFFG